MGAQRVAAIADAGPLIHLYEIGQIKLLDLFSAVHVPAIVWQEATESGRVPDERLLGVPVIQKHTPAQGNWRNGERFSHLHGGEREALRLCEELDIPLLLTDDLAAREAAVGVGVTPVGSVGIVAKSHVAGMIDISEAERALRQLGVVSRNRRKFRHSNLAQYERSCNQVPYEDRLMGGGLAVTPRASMWPQSAPARASALRAASFSGDQAAV